MAKTSTSTNSFPWGIILKLIVSVGLIVWLLNKIDMAKVWILIQDIHKGILFIALTLIWLTLLVIAKRWQLVVRLSNNEPPLSSLTEATFIGAFFNQFLPSSVGGDFFRIVAVRQYGASLNEAITGVLVDRLFGFLSLGLLCILALPAEVSVLMGSDLMWPFILTMVLLLGVCVGGVLLLIIPNHWHIHPLIRPLCSLIEMVRRAYTHKGLFLVLMAVSLIASIVLISGLQLLMTAFDIPLTWQQGAAILPVVMLLTSLPISFAGWGLREGAMIVALGAYGVPQETALALSLVYGVLHLVSGLPGLVLWFLEKRRLRPAPSSL